MSNFIIEELRKYLIAERDKLAEKLFIADVQQQLIQFQLRTDSHNWEMPNSMWTDLPENSPKLLNNKGLGMEKNLFTPVYKEEFNSDEENFACYLDANSALIWWHRNVAKPGQYFIQGWRKNKVYPDFIFAQNKGKIVIIETKGDQLEGNLDTKYKQKLLSLTNDHFDFNQSIKAGTIEIVINEKTHICCDLLLISEWQNKINDFL